MRIVYMGTPEFAVKPLDELFRAGNEIVAVVTSVDKASGRGLQISESPVKKYALNKGFKILQPSNLKDESFFNELCSLNAEIFVVVAFRMLPKQVWTIPPKGTINLHASLLPNYRGAAPINWAIINGETITGVSTFYINEQIDTGKVIQQRQVEIEQTDDAGSLHDKLMLAGAKLLVETVEEIENSSVCALDQNLMLLDELKQAPKIFKEHCKIDWNQSAFTISNLIRGLSPLPGAFTFIHKQNMAPKMIKLFSVDWMIEPHELKPGKIVLTDNKLKVAVNDGFIIVEKLQIEGKSRMDAQDFIRGFKVDNAFLE